MRWRELVVVPIAAAVFGCGDGVGHPIVEPEQQRPSAGGSGGSSTGGALTTSATTGGAEGGGATFVPGAGKGGGDYGPPRSDYGGDSGGGWTGRGPRDPNEPGVVPDGAVCEAVADWNAIADAEEQDFVRFLNFTRESGFACGSGEPLQAGPLEVTPELRCAARLHSKDMSERGFFDHVNPDGDGPEERMRRAGATFRVASETIALVDDPGGPGEGDRWQILSQLLMARGDDCRNVADPSFDKVGVGLFDGLLTLEFTGP